jgi:hypothetical protein
VSDKKETLSLLKIINSGLKCVCGNYLNGPEPAPIPQEKQKKKSFSSKVFNMIIFSKNSKNKKVEEIYFNEEVLNYPFEKEKNVPSGNLIFNFINLKAEVEEMVLFYDDSTITDLDVKPENEKKSSRVKYFRFFAFKKRKNIPDNKCEKLDRLKKNLIASNEVGVSERESEILISGLNERHGSKSITVNNGKLNSATHTVVRSRSNSMSNSIFKQRSDKNLKIKTEKYLDKNSTANDDVQPWEATRDGGREEDEEVVEGGGEGGRGRGRERQYSVDNDRNSGEDRGRDRQGSVDRSRGSKKNRDRSREKDREKEREKEDEFDSFSLRISSHNHSLKPSMCPSPSAPSSPSPSIDSYTQGRGRKYRHSAPDRSTDFNLPLPLSLPDSLPSSMLESDCTVRQITKSYPKSLNSENHNSENLMDTEFEKTGNLKILDVDIDDSVMTEYRWKNEEKTVTKAKSEEGNIDTFQISTSLKKPFSPTKKHKRSLHCVLS